MTGRVRTVLGDIDAATLGATYMHEHLIIESDLVADEWPHISLTSVDDAVAEAGLCRIAGVGSMVDAMPMASGRRPRKLAEIGRRSGVNIVMATGLHTEKYYRGIPWALDGEPDDLADRFITDITVGVDENDGLASEASPTDIKAGIVKAATSHEGVTPRAERLFEAAWIAMQATGVPLLTHCEEGTGAMEQIELLSAIGVPLERVVMSHTDKVDDPRYHADLLETGVSLEFDQAIRQGADAAAGTAKLLAAQLERGFVQQLMLGTDGARRSLWATYGHDLGLAWLSTGYRAILGTLDIDEDMQHTMFVTNPQRLLTLHMPTPAVGEATTKSATQERVPRNRETV